MTSLDCDVAIVGLGSTGAALAAQLGIFGISAIGLEAQPDVNELPRARMVDGEIMRIFQSIGVAQELEERFLSAPPFRFLAADGELLMERDFGAGPRRNGWHNSYMIHQPDIEMAINRRLADLPSISVRRGYAVRDIVEHDDHVEVSAEALATGDIRVVRARYVVGCDGGKSIVRRALGSRYRVLGEDYPWCFVDVELRRPVELPEHNFYILDPQRPMAYLRNPRDYRRFYFRMLPGEQGEQITSDEMMWSLLAPWLAPGDADFVLSTVFNFHSLLADRWRRGRLMIAGDAAHQMTPTMAQGLCSGMRDAVNLAWKLAFVINGRASEALLGTYESERMSHAQFMVEMSDKLASWWSILDPDAAEARNAMLRTLSIDPPDLRLGPGLHHESTGPVGRLFPQSEAPHGKRLDDKIGLRFALIDPRDLLARAPEAQSALDRLGGCVISPSEGAAPADPDLEGLAIVVRPDRYVLGVATTPDELNQVFARMPGLN